MDGFAYVGVEQLIISGVKFSDGKFEFISLLLRESHYNSNVWFLPPVVSDKLSPGKLLRVRVLSQLNFRRTQMVVLPVSVILVGMC